MNEICDYIEKKKLMDYIQNEIVLNNTDMEELEVQGLKYLGPSSSSPTFLVIGSPYDVKRLGTSPFLSNFVNDENVELPERITNETNDIIASLSFNEEIKADIIKLLHKMYTVNTSISLSISKSGDNEFLVYINSNGTFKNILVNEDGDIELLVIPPDRRKSYNKTFYKEDGINYSKVVDTFNAMR